MFYLIANAFLVKTCTFPSVSKLIRKENAVNAITDIFYSTMHVHLFHSYVTPTTRQPANAQHVHSAIFSRMTIAFSPLSESILDAPIIPTRIAPNAKLVTILTISTAIKSIADAQTSITLKMYAQNASAQHLKVLIASDLKTLILILIIFCL